MPDPTPAPPTTDQPSSQPPIVQTLTTASAGLQMPSESDFPFRAFFLESKEKDAPLKPDTLPEPLKLESKTPVEKRSLSDFLGDAATVEDWMEGEEKATAEKFAALLKTVKKELEKPAVYVFGERKLDAVIIGHVEGGFAGLVTQVVET